ncbi:MAG: hypothetical protein HYY21_09515 [Candidatus Tectomicrobia bacterium]|nr:hypothetical protein [Candidatus Tectomicrobia bacterium]
MEGWKGAGLSRALTVAWVAFVLAGCAASPPEKGRQELAPQYRFEDVPVHPSLRIDSHESFIFETRSLKAGILVYRGSPSMTEVVEFFKAEMPKHAWRLNNSVEARGAVTLNFDKEGWSALIRVSRGAIATDVEITIGPKDSREPAVPPPPTRR